MPDLSIIEVNTLRDEKVMSQLDFKGIPRPEVRAEPSDEMDDLQIENLDKISLKQNIFV